MNAENYSEIFKALGHPIRLKIACGLLHKGKCNVNTMVENLNESQSLISQHINILKKRANKWLSRWKYHLVQIRK